jgi:hypothetical protein
MSDASPGPEPRRISRPLRQLIRVLVFLALVGFVVFILNQPMRSAFMANPGLNGLIVGVLVVGLLVAFREFVRLDREVGAANRLKAGDPAGRARSMPIIAPVAAVLPALQRRGLGIDQVAVVTDAVSVRLDEGRETLRYLAGLLVFLGLLGTFWGLLETVSSVGGVINTLRTGGEAGVLFEELKAGLSAPLSGMGLSFSSSLFGIAGSLVLGFVDLQLGQAQRGFRTELEDWISASAHLSPSEPAAPAAPAPAIGTAPAADNRELVARLEKVAQGLSDATGGGRQSTQAMANLAEGIQSLVQHMRSEQQLIRDWVEAQAQREKETRRLLERLIAERDRAG